MDGIAGSLRLGWKALLLKEDAYEEMRISDNPVVKGLILIVVVGVVIALLGFVGDLLEWASMPDLGEIENIVHYYITRMPWWDLAAKDPQFTQTFDQIWNMNWSIVGMFMPDPGSALANIILLPLALVVRWLIYGLFAYLFARWLGGTANLSETLGVLALAVAPQVLNVLNLLPQMHLGNVVAVWGILCAYVGLKTAHRLSWSRAVWATLLPFILAFGVAMLSVCLGTSIFAAVVKGG
jgi:hypothetical protein